MSLTLSSTPPFSTMLHSSSFYSIKTRKMRRDHDERKATGRYRFRDLSHMKFTDIFKSLRRRKLRQSKVPHRSPLGYSQSFPPPFSDLDSLIQHPSPYLASSPSFFPPLYRCGSASFLSITEEDSPSSILRASGSRSPDAFPPGGEKYDFLQQSVSTFPTSPTVFQLRSASTNDYLVERLEHHLRRLDLRDASLDDVALPKDQTARDAASDVPMDVCLGSPKRAVADSEPTRRSSRRPPADKDAHKPKSSPCDLENVVPMILITSVDAKHAKPLPLSEQRPSGRTPFAPSNHPNQPTNIPSATLKLKTPDDPFMTQPHSYAFPANHDLTFRLPSFPLAYPSPTWYSPETPTPMCCDHFGDCKGDLWDILHPPLVAGTFTLPPFEMPPLRTGIFDDVAMPLPN